jgi:hypothetical protein
VYDGGGVVFCIGGWANEVVIPGGVLAGVVCTTVGDPGVVCFLGISAIIPAIIAATKSGGMIYVL